MKIYYADTSGIGYLRGHVIKARDREHALQLIEAEIGKKIDPNRIREILKERDICMVIEHTDNSYEG